MSRTALGSHLREMPHRARATQIASGAEGAISPLRGSGRHAMFLSGHPPLPAMPKASRRSGMTDYAPRARRPPKHALEDAIAEAIESLTALAADASRRCGRHAGVSDRNAVGRCADRAGLRCDRRWSDSRAPPGARRSRPKSPATRRQRRTISAPAPPTFATSATRCCARFPGEATTLAPAGAILLGDDITPTLFLRDRLERRRRYCAVGRQHCQPRRHAGAGARRTDGGRPRRRPRRLRRGGTARCRARHADDPRRTRMRMRDSAQAANAFGAAAGDGTRPISLARQPRRTERRFACR